MAPGHASVPRSGEPADPEGFDRAPVAPDAGRQHAKARRQRSRRSARGRCDEKREGHMSAPTTSPDHRRVRPRGRRHHRHRGHRQRQLRQPHHHLRDRPARQAGRRLRRRHHGRHHAAVGHHGRPSAEGAVRLLPADRRRRGADVRRRAHPRLVLPPRGPPVRGRDPHLPADRPPAAPDLRQGPAQRGPGRHHRPVAGPRSTSTTCSRSTAPRRPPSSPACRSPARSAAPASP